MSGNSLSTLPDTLVSLKQLRNINLTGNKFEAYPEVLSLMSTLTHIDLSNNHVTTVTKATVDGLPSELENVCLLDNPLTEESKALLLNTGGKILL